MGKILNYNRRKIAKERFRFFSHEIAIIFLLIFGLSILEWILLPLIIPQSTALFGLLFYLIRSLILIAGIVIVFYISFKVVNKDSPQTNKEISPHIGLLRLYKISQKNYKYQFLYGFLLLFLILIPLESIFLPMTLDYRARSLNIQNSYLLIDNVILFIIFTLIIQFSIAFSEVTIFYGFITKRGSEHFDIISAVLISTFYFAFTEFFLNPLTFVYPISFGIIWFFKSFIIGLVFSLTTIRRKWLFPLIFARTFDYVLSSIIIWNYIGGNNIMIFVYSPLLVVSLTLLILQRSRIKESLQIGIDLIRPYYKKDSKMDESKGDKVFRILFDMFFALLLFIFGMLVNV
jgi:hypothetical protein